MLMDVEKLVARLVFGQLAGGLAVFGVDEVGEEWVFSCILSAPPKGAWVLVG